MTKKIFGSIMIVVGAVLLASLLIIMGCLYDYFGDVQEKQLSDELELASSAVESGGADYLSTLKAENYRITWVAADGDVIFDTKTDASAMENHANREEIKAALEAGRGQSVRYSSTLAKKTVYSAKKLSDGSVLRVSVSQDSVGSLVVGMLQPTIIVIAVALLLAFILARSLSKRIVGPLNRLNLDSPLENDTYDELSPLLSRLAGQQRENTAQLQRLQHQRDEFVQIIGSMKEALVLLDSRGTVISINPTACRIFDTDETHVGSDFLTIERRSEVSAAIEDALKGGHSEIRMERNGRSYQLDVSRIESGDAVIGAVLLAFDVTEQEFAERNRREFTANVSHELKTPLQGIIGSAELIENNMVKPDDLPRFVGHIRQEASRLVALIEDIIRLSQLDEGEALPTESVSLLTLANEAAASLADAADSKSVSVSVTGDGAEVIGVRRLLYEIIYNLCDNAIKYNVVGGKVEISVSADDKNAVLSVRDTGIGIPEEHQARVFERFYRVDKSHSKASGGTGLGLSIVKHATAYHHGSIDLKSRSGEGTEITVTLPREN